MNDDRDDPEELTDRGDSEDQDRWSVLPKLVALGDRDRTRKLRRSLWTWLIVVVVVVTGIGTVVNLVMVDREPQDPVADWLQSMVSGQSRQGLASSSIGFGYAGASALPNRTYRAATGRIDRWEIVDVQTSGDTAEVTAQVWWPDGEVPEGSTQGEEHTWSVVKERRTGPFNDHWVMHDHEAAELSVSAPGVNSITINGVNQRLNPRDRTVAQGSGGVWTWEAMPGQFEIGLPDDGDYVLATDLDPLTVALNSRESEESSESHAVAIDLEPSPNLWTEVDEAIAERIEDCMSQTSVAPTDCPVSQRWADGNVPRAEATATATLTGATATPTALASPSLGATIEDVEWELESRPALWLIPDDDTGSPLDWQASEHTTAQARLTYLEDGRRVEETIEFPVHVSVTSDGTHAEINISLD